MVLRRGGGAMPQAEPGWFWGWYCEGCGWWRRGWNNLWLVPLTIATIRVRESIIFRKQIKEGIHTLKLIIL